MDVVCVNRDHLSRSGVADNGGSRTNGGILVFAISSRSACELPFSPSWHPAFPPPPGEPRSAFRLLVNHMALEAGNHPPSPVQWHRLDCIHIFCGTCHLPHNALPDSITGLYRDLPAPLPPCLLNKGRPNLVAWLPQVSGRGGGQ